MSDEKIITQPALGQDVQLGMLYDARSMQFYAGVSLWDDEVVNKHQELEEGKVQDSQYSLSYSLQEARKNSSLDIEASLGLDLKLFSASGSAKYLNDTKSSTHEARVDVACTVVRRTRRIPQETLAKMTYERHLDDPRYTHFVAEVVEGGAAALTFARSCSDEEEVTKVTGELKVTIVKIPISGGAKIEYSTDEKKLFETVNISYSGAMAESVVNLEDALRVARDMPTKLSKQLNTLRYKLLPLSVLDSKANRLIRGIDAGLVTETSAALRDGADATLALKELGEEEVFKKQFHSIQAQILNFSKAFSKAEVEFTKVARRLLPELRDGNTDENDKIAELQTALHLFQSRTDITKEYISAKVMESSVLRTTVAELLAQGFENHLGGYKSLSLLGGKAPRLLLSFGGPTMGKRKHPLQTALEKQSPVSGHEGGDDAPAADDDGDDDDDDEEEEEEWFEDQSTVSAVRLGCSQLLQQRSLSIPDVPVIFGVASINKAYRPGKRTRSSTSVGDIILDDKGQLSIVSGKLAHAAAAPKLQVDNQTITVTWEHDRTREEESVIPTTGYVIKYKRQPNPDKDGAFSRATDNELFTEVMCGANETCRVLKDLSDDCDYVVAVSVQTSVGASDWSPGSVERTVKLPSVASDMLEFFNENKQRLSASPRTAPPGDVAARKPWDLDSPGAGKKPSLFLGTVEVSRRRITGKRFKDELAVRIVDVAPEFRPEIVASGVEDVSKTIVAVFTGASGHGKSTEINAFISYLFGGDLEDAARIMVIDDRGAKQSGSVTQMVTCYRIRPLSSAFAGKTLLVVDTPGFGDSRGFERDAFVTSAMSEFFKTVNHVNAVIFTVRANQARTAFLRPISTYVFSLFAKDVRGCLRTAYTFSDAGAPLARGALRELGWPVENGEIAVNNSAFTIVLDGGQKDAMIRETWIRSVQGQFKVMAMLRRAAPVSTHKSSEVTRKRMMLEGRCELAEKTILQTANEAQTLIAQLSALAEAVGKAPGQKVKVVNDVSVQKPVQDDKSTTLCLDCNFTCHEVCALSDDAEKMNCVAMSNGFCTVCKKKCKWDRHRNARYIIVVEQQEQWVVPEDLIKNWNKANNSLEGALLGAMDTYLDVQKSLQGEIMKLAKLSEELTETALLHDPSGLINYLETLFKTAQAQGAPSEHLAQLITAINTLILVCELKGKGETVTRDSSILLDVVGSVRKEMERRMNLTAMERAAEEERPCNLYNSLREQLTGSVKAKAPPALKINTGESQGARYSDNLKAVIKLIRLVITDGGVIAAIQRRGKH